MFYSNRSFMTSVSCVLFGFALYAPAAFAALSDDPPSIKLDYSGLDLSKTSGAEVLYRRIKNAAHTVCAESYRNVGPFRPHTDQKKCEAQAIENAVRDVDRPLLSALWQNQTRVASNR